ncbi:MAG: hypothetical protein ABDH21_00800 [bacterium]
MKVFKFLSKTLKKITLLLILLMCICFSQELHIYIHNKKYKGQYIYKAPRIYVEIEVFVNMTGLKMYKQGNYYVISKDNIIPPQTFTSLVYYNNKPLRYVIFENQKVFIDLLEISYLTDSIVEFNKETGIVDYYSKTKLKQTAEELYKASQQVYQTQKEVYDKKIQAGEKVQAGEKPKIPKDAIKIIEEMPAYEDRNNRGELRYTAKVKNTYKEKIEQITVKIKITSPAGELLHQEVFKFPSLNPGQTKEIFFYWINNTTISNPVIKHEIDFKGKEEQEKT